MKQNKSILNLSSKILGASLFCLTTFVPNAYSQTRVENSAYYTKPSAVNSQQFPSLVSNIAQQVTVRIFTDNSAGSGVIIKREGNNIAYLFKFTSGGCPPKMEFPGQRLEGFIHIDRHCDGSGIVRLTHVSLLKLLRV